MDLAIKTIRLNRKNPAPRPSRTLNDVILSWQMKFLRESNNNEFKEVVVSGQNHTCKMKLDSLNPINLCEMQVPMIHKERLLICRTIVDPFSSIATQTIVEDLNGDVENLHIYNYSADTKDTTWLPIGTILIIKEPYLQYTTNDQEVCIRVDSPSDLIFVEASDEKLLQEVEALKWCLKQPQNVRDVCIEANDQFRAGNFEQAIRFYNRAIQINPNFPQLHLNKSMACLHVGFAYEAYQEAKLGLEKGGDSRKAVYRMALAAYSMRNFELAAEHFKFVYKHNPQNAEIKQKLKRTLERLNESKTGDFDFKTMFLLAQNGRNEFDVAEYRGPIEIATIEGKGRGLVASRNISKGTLLLVSKAFAVGYDQDCLDPILFVNLLQNKNHIQIAKARHKFQVIRAVDALRKQPQKAKELYELYAGDELDDKDANENIDVARIEQICLHNSFGNSHLKREHEDAVESWSEQDATMLFLLPSYFNHSCVANAHREHYGDILVVHAVKDLKKGDEITICYVPPTVGYKKRLDKFNNLWGFPCRCDLCVEDERDGNCAKRTKLLEQFNEYAQYSMNEEKILRKGELTLKQIRDTYKTRQNFQVDLVQMLQSMASIYSNLNKVESSIECMEECMMLAVNDFPKTLKVDETALKLALAYVKLDEKQKAKEFLEKSLELSLCVDIEHFQLVYPVVGKIRKYLDI